jgi:DNA-binding transcriptional MerR regulator
VSASDQSPGPSGPGSNPPNTRSPEAIRTGAGWDRDRLYRTAEIVELLGISRRQLQYWSQTGLVEPSARTRGGHRRYDFADLVALGAAARLIEAGISLQRIRKSLDALRQTLPHVRRPLAECVLVATGDVVLVFGKETAFEAVTGQEWVFPVADLERRIASLPGTRRSEPARRARVARRDGQSMRRTG